MRRKIISTLSYLFFTFLIFSWWTAAFTSGNQEKSKHIQNFQEIPQTKNPSPYLPYLTSLKRDEIKRALSGDIHLMSKLINDWDVDAQIMETHGIIGSKRLPRKDYLRAQIIGRQINLGLQEKVCKQVVRDDAGRDFYIEKPLKRFLPQTFMSATYLLSLLDPSNIIALPYGLREQTNLFPLSITKAITNDTNRFNSEKLYLENPDLAFVANFSNPSTVQTLANQGIDLFTLNAPEELSDIKDTLKKVGHVTNRAKEAELLSLFMESALIAIDNHLLAAFHDIKKTPKVLFLNYHAYYSTPSQKTLTGKLLNRLGDSFYTYKDDQDKLEWMIPLNQEKIVNFNPDYLIVASSHQDAVLNQILDTPAFCHINAVKDHRICCVDVDIQLSPTQFIVLAYYDIMQSLVSL